MVTHLSQLHFGSQVRSTISTIAAKGGTRTRNFTELTGFHPGRSHFEKYGSAKERREVILPIFSKESDQ